MNGDQAARRIKNVLRARRWKGSGDNVFARDSVIVSVAPAQEAVDQLGLPAAFIAVGAGRADNERPGLIERDVTVRIVVAVPGDMLGESPMIGANRLSKTSNEGRGILEVESELLAAAEQLDASNQFRIAHQFSSPILAQLDDDTGYHCWADYTFRALLTSVYQHQEPRAATASESGGTVTVSWTEPDDTTNLVSYIVRRTTGTIPVAFPDEGTSVSWASGTSTTDAPDSGTYTYSIFAAYDDLGGSVEHDVSDYAAVTITF